MQHFAYKTLPLEGLQEGWQLILAFGCQISFCSSLLTMCLPSYLALPSYLVLKGMDIHLLDDSGCALRATSITFMSHMSLME